MIISNSKFGIEDNENNIHIPPIYTRLSKIPNTNFYFAAIKYFKFGIIDNNNNIKLNFEYSTIEYFKDYFIVNKNKEKHGIYDLNFNLILPTIYDSIRYIKSFNIFVIEQYDEYGVYDPILKKIIIPMNYIKIYRCSNCYIVKNSDDIYNIYESDGTYIPVNSNSLEYVIDNYKNIILKYKRKIKILNLI